jgi:copper transport protein
VVELITRREAALRTAAIAGLTGLAIVQLAALPYSLVQGPQIAAISVAAIAATLRLAFALATAGASGGRAAWRGTAVLGGLISGGWFVTRAVAVPGVAEDAGHWASRPGLACAGLGIGLVALGAAGAGVPRRRRGLRALAGTAAVSLALAPAAALLLVALGPAPAHRHGLAAASIGPHRLHAATAASAAADAARFRPGFGGHSGRYVYANATRAHLPAWALALGLGGAAVFVSLARGALRRRVAADAPASASSRVRRRALTLVALCALALALPAAGASAHATLVRASPAALARVASAPRRVTLVFSEPVQAMRSGGVALLDHAGRQVPATTVRRTRGGRVLVLAVRGALPADSYTVRYRVISADAHALAGAVTFAVGGAPLLPPAGGAAAGPAETGAWAVDARFTELAALGLLLALVAFRWLVWERALEGATGLTGRERAAAAAAGRRRFWRAFWCVAALAGIAEAAVLVVKAALVFGSGVWGSLTTPAAAERLLASSRFGDLLGLRGGLLCAIAAIALWQWLNEAGEPRARAGGAVAIGALSAGALGLVAAQGHASQAPLAALQVGFDAVHLGAAAIWLGGLACLAVVLRAAPRALPGDAGAALAAAVLRRFSRVALGAVAVIAATGLARALGELDAPAQLWATPYGRSLLAKTLLLAPVAVLALRNRRAIAALARGGRPTAAALRRVWRDVRAELAFGTTIVLVASVLVAQVPGRV